MRSSGHFLVNLLNVKVNDKRDNYNQYNCSYELET